MKEPDRLSRFERRFAEEYMVDFNVSKAVERSNYRGKSKPYALLRKPKIQKFLRERLQSMIVKASVTPESVIAELAAVGFREMGEYGEWGPDGIKFKPSSELTREQRAAVMELREEVTVSERGEEYRKIKFKLHPKVAALKGLEKYLEMGGMGMVPWSDVLSGLAEMARVVELYVDDPVTLLKIKDAWSAIPIRPQKLVTNGRSQ